MIKPILLTLALVSTPLAAKEEQASCEQLASLAEVIMDNRQQGVPLVDMIKTTDNGLIREIIKMAYKRPQYPEGYRDEPITDFQNDIYLECLESMD